MSTITLIFSSPSTYPLPRVLLGRVSGPRTLRRLSGEVVMEGRMASIQCQNTVDPPVASEGVRAGGEQLRLPWSLQPPMPASSPEYHVLSVSHVS